MTRPGVRYSLSARLLHWMTAALIPVMFVLGVWMVWFTPEDGAASHRLFNLHETLGVVVLLVVLLRLGVRVAHRPPPLPPGIPPVVRAAATTDHLALYGLLLAMPILGYLANDAEGVRLVWFELVPLPTILGREAAAAQVLSMLHLSGAVAVLLLVALHLCGVAYHALLRRDGVLRRML